MQKNPKAGEIWLISHPDAEANKELAIVLSIPELRHLPYRLVVPVRKWIKRNLDFAWLVSIPPSRSAGLEDPHEADAKQCRCFQVDQFAKRTGRISAEELTHIRHAVAMCIGVAPC